MDYVEAFKNLKTNNKYSRKSPHKAILLLTVIEMYESGVLTDNIIYYNDELKGSFLKVWNRVLKEEPLFHPDAFYPFWYLQSEDFWHIVPYRGKEGILALMRDTNVKPSESKIVDCVKYVELDEDLYFLMTLQSGRSSLKRVLLENYTNLSIDDVDKMSSSVDNSVDYSVSAISEYEKIISNNKDSQKCEITNIDNNLMNQFLELNDDVQITLNLEYYSYLKNNREKRTLFKDVFPTIYDLFDHIVNKPLRRDELSTTLAVSYENFLSDLRISLMSEDDSMRLIEKVNESIEILQKDSAANDSNTTNYLDFQDTKECVEEKTFDTAVGNLVDEGSDKDDVSETRRGKVWTMEEEDLLSLSFRQGKDYLTIARELGRTEIAIKSRLGKLGLIDYVYGEDVDSGFKIENFNQSCSILNKQGIKIFTSEGKLKYINGKLYRLNLKKECFTVKSMLFENEMWIKGDKKIVAYPRTKLYSLVNRMYDYSQDVEDIEDSPVFEKCRLKFKGEWYCYDGTPLTAQQVLKPKTDDLENNNEVEADSSKFSVKVGDVLKLFPSQLVGAVVRLRVDKSGRRKIIVQSSDGPRVEIYDSKFLYQKVFDKKNEQKSSVNEHRRIKKNHEIESDYGSVPEQSSTQYATTGDWIQLKITGEVGRVIASRNDDGIRKMLVRKKSGYEIEVIDNPGDYEIILNTQKVEKNEVKPPINAPIVQNNRNHNAIKKSRIGGVKVGDWIKSQHFIDKCKVVRIESIGPSLEKLIVEFKDGHQDWVIDNPDIYRIVKE